MADLRIKDIVPTATEADLVSGNYLPLDGSAGTKKLPAEDVAKRSVQNSLLNHAKRLKVLTDDNTNRIEGENISVSTSAGTYRKGSLGASTWYYNSTPNSSHVAYKVLKGSIVTIENTGSNPNGSWFALVTDFADEDKANGDAISFSTQLNERRNLAVGDSVKIYIDSDLWLVCNVIDGAGIADEFSVDVVLPDLLESERGSIDGMSKNYDLSEFINYNSSLGALTWYNANGASNTALPVKVGQSVTIENNGTKIIYCALLTSSFVLKNQTGGTSIPFSSQMAGRFSVDIGESKTLEIAGDSAWIVFNVVDGAGDSCSADVTITENGVAESIDSFKYGKTETIGTDSRLSYNAILGASTWYYNSTPNPHHVPIRVFAGQVVTIENTGAKIIYCGLLTSSYALGDKSNLTPVPFSSQMGERFSVDVGESKTLEIKDDSEWLVLNVVDGAGDSCSADVTIVTTSKSQPLSTDFFALYSRVRPNINTTDGTLEIDHFTIIFYGDDVYNYYTAVNPQSSVPLKTGASSAQKLVYNAKTHAFRTCDFGDDINILEDVVVGAFYVNSGANYTTFNSASLPFDYTIDGIPVYVKDDISTYNLDYDGEPIKIVANKYKRDLYKTLPSLTFHQSMAIYGDYALFAVYGRNTSGTSEAGKLSFYLYNIKTSQRIAGIDVPYTGWTIPHCNTAMFGKEFGSADSVVPLLYLSQWNGERACLVYDITLTGDTYSASLVQTISTSGISSDVEGAGMRDWVVDVDDNSIYSFGYLLNSDSVAEGNKIMLVKFDLPELSEGDKVFGTADIKDSYNVPFIKYYQDKTINFGKMYIGAGSGAMLDTKVLALDLAKKKIVTEIPLGKTYTIEPEGLDVYEDKLLLDYGYDSIYELKTAK